MTDDTDLANNEGFPLEEASAWIATWRAIGGGFFVKEGPEGVLVQLARETTPNALGVDVHELRGEQMQTELVSQPRLKMAVSVLVRNAWERKLIENVPPAGTA